MSAPVCTTGKFGEDANGCTLAFSSPGNVEFDYASGRMTPTEARAAIDALHAAVHAAADHADSACEVIA